MHQRHYQEFSAFPFVFSSILGNKSFEIFVTMGVDSSYRMPHHTQVAVFTVCEQRLVVPPLLDDARHLCSVKQASNVFPNAPS
eukprot:g76903.t1